MNSFHITLHEVQYGLQQRESEIFQTCFEAKIFMGQHSIITNLTLIECLQNIFEDTHSIVSTSNMILIQILLHIFLKKIPIRKQIEGLKVPCFLIYFTNITVIFSDA